jgi:dephospho-CoA kinase
MRRILITGMSATGKSTVIEELARRGYSAVDVDHPDWSHYDASGEWVWREDRVAELLMRHGDGTLFVSGCSSNMPKFYQQFDKIILLSASEAVMRERLASRTTNTFGKTPDELAQIMDDLQHIEPLLRRRADQEIDTSAPIDDVVTTVLRIAGVSR